jgi:tRNA A37 threonylcarbamoyladenosine modification protein TsaB
VGLTAALTMSRVLKIPAVGVSNLEVSYFWAQSHFPNAQVLVAEDARRKQVYFAFNNGAPNIEDPQLVVNQLTASLPRAKVPIDNVALENLSAENAQAEEVPIEHLPQDHLPVKNLLLIGSGITKYEEIFAKLQPTQTFPTILNQADSGLIYAKLAQKILASAVDSYAADSVTGSRRADSSAVIDSNVADSTADTSAVIDSSVTDSVTDSRCTTDFVADSYRAHHSTDANTQTYNLSPLYLRRPDVFPNKS